MSQAIIGICCVLGNCGVQGNCNVQGNCIVPENCGAQGNCGVSGNCWVLGNCCIPGSGSLSSTSPTLFSSGLTYLKYKVLFVCFGFGLVSAPLLIPPVLHSNRRTLTWHLGTSLKVSKVQTNHQNHLFLKMVGKMTILNNLPSFL